MKIDPISAKATNPSFTDQICVQNFFDHPLFFTLDFFVALEIFVRTLQALLTIDSCIICVIASWFLIVKCDLCY